MRRFIHLTRQRFRTCSTEMCLRTGFVPQASYSSTWTEQTGFVSSVSFCYSLAACLEFPLWKSRDQAKQMVMIAHTRVHLCCWQRAQAWLHPALPVGGVPNQGACQKGSAFHLAAGMLPLFPSLCLLLCHHHCSLPAFPCQHCLDSSSLS